MKIYELRKVCKLTGQICPKCESRNITILNSTTPNMSGDTCNSCKCNDCGKEYLSNGIDLYLIQELDVDINDS